MTEFGLQIYSVRDRFTTPEDTKEALLALGKMGYSHIQTAGTYDYISPELFVKHVSDTIERLSGRVDILHLKDLTADRSVPRNYPKSMVCVGEGNINFKRIIDVAEAAGVKYFVVEDDRCPVGKSLEYAKRSADYIKENLIK